MKFISHRKFTSYGVDYAAAQLETSSRFSVTRLSDGMMAFTDRKPRKDSKVWSHKFMVWDIDNNRQATN